MKAREVEAIEQATTLVQPPAISVIPTKPAAISAIPTKPAAASTTPAQPTEENSQSFPEVPKILCYMHPTGKLCLTEYPITFKADWSDG